MNGYLPVLITAWLAFCAAALSPGPNNVAVVSRALGSGRGSALAVAFGIAIGAFFWALLSSFGLGALFERFPILLRVLGVFGGLYLAWMGFKGWRSAIKGCTGEIAPIAGKDFRQDILYGLTVTTSNPKAALFWGSLSTYVSSAVPNNLLLVLFALVSAILAFVIYGGYGILFSLGKVRGFYKKFSRITEALFGTIFSVIGIGMVARALLGK